MVCQFKVLMRLPKRRITTTGKLLLVNGKNKFIADEDGEPVVVPNDIEEEENVGIVTEEIEAAPEITNENLESNTFIVAVGEHDGGGLNTDLSDSDSSGSDDNSSTDEPSPQVVGAATAALTKRARVSNTMLGSVKGGKYSKRK